MKRGCLLVLVCLLAATPATAARLFRSTGNVVGTPTPPQGTALADLNRDGLADLVTPLSPGLGVALATGGGSFAPYVVSFAARGGTVFFDIVDVDGDGLLDAAGQRFPGTPDSTEVFVAYGDGNGGWLQEVGHVVPRIESWSLAVGDLDDDGRPEIVVGTTDTTLVVLRANVDRTLVNIGSYPTTGFVGAGVLADVVGTSAPDLVVGSFTGVSIFAGNGDGTLGAHTDVNLGGDFNSVSVAQVDGIGGLDVVVGGPGVFWAANLGGGTFSAPIQFPTPGLVINLATARDFDGNGTIDVGAVHRGAYRGITVWPGDGNGGFGAAIESPLTTFDPSSLAFGDVDGDGRVDVACRASFASDIVVGIGQAAGRFGQLQSIPRVPGRIFGLAGGDFDEDGHLDAIGCDTENLRLAFARGHGDGMFDPLAMTSVAGASYTRLVSGRFDSDAHLDLVGTSSAAISFLRGHGDGTFDAPIDYAPGSTRTPVAADIDGDGDLDVALPDPTANAIRVLLQGPGGLAPPVASPSIAGAFSVRYADLDGDGKIDRVVGGTNQWRVELADGLGGYAPLAAHPQTPTPGDLELADFDEDGRLDIVVGQGLSGSAPFPAIVHVWHGQSGGAFDSEATANLNWVIDPAAVHEGVASLIARDFDGDGHVDLVARSATGASQGTVARGHGDRSFGPPEAYVTSTGAAGLVTGDFDEDGWLDLMSAGGTGTPAMSSMTFIKNLSAGVVGVPVAPRGAAVALTITRLAPNPNRGAFALDLSASAAGEARVTLVSPAGRVVLDQAAALRAGANRVALTTNGLRPGIYWARAEAFGEAVARKVVLLP